MRASRPIGLICLFLIVICLFSGMYTVQEGQQALLLRFGKILYNADAKPMVLKPGLGFKVPFLNQVRAFDTRLQTLAVQSSRILTKEQKYVLVDYYVKWRIQNLPLYYKRTVGSALRAQTLLQQQVNDSLRAAFGQRTITEMVSGERLNVMELLRKRANDTAQNLGIVVNDVRIKSIDLPREVSNTVFERMRTRREQVATQHRSNGKAKAEMVRARADAGATILVAEAKTKAANIRAQGQREAAEVYAQAYGRDPDFFAFYASLEAYKAIFSSKEDMIVLTPQSAFLKYFNHVPLPRSKHATAQEVK